MIAASQVVFTRPYAVAVCEVELPAPGPNQVMVQSTVSAISAGTELLFYRGQVPADMTADMSIDGLRHGVEYPIAYGYSTVGVVAQVGANVPEVWLGRRVFAFQPHTSHFVCDIGALHPIPDHIRDEQAVLLPNMETAVNLVMDARPVIGEDVLIFGQGVVGLLTLRLLRRFPLASLIVVDGIPQRRERAQRWGADQVLAPDAVDDLDTKPDLILEVSSNPEALRQAVRIAGFGTRIIVGSWYGDKPATLDLGGNYHRNRVSVISSQVSTVDGTFANRWGKARRLATAWQQLAGLPVDDLITHRLHRSAAAEAYRLLDQSPAEAIQVLLIHTTSTT